MRILVEVERDTAMPMLQSMQRGLADKKALNRAAAEGMLPLVQRNLRNMSETNHNVFGARSSFWNQMLSGTYSGADDEGGFVSMPRPVALRYFGGTVFPVEAKDLAEPARSEAYGKSPRDFSDLRLAVLGTGPKGGPILALIQNDQQKIKYGPKRKDGSRNITPGAESGGGVFFWLVPSATIRPDPNVLPTPEELSGAAEQGVADYIGLLARRAA